MVQPDFYPMTKTERTAFENLLLHDLQHFAGRLRMGEMPKAISAKEAAYILNLAERLSRSNESGDRNLCLLICALIWEYREETWDNMPQFVMNLLSRIGLGPALPMVDDEYSSSGSLYRPWGSGVMEAIIEARNYTHEVSVCGKLPVVLSAFQKEAWDMIGVQPRVGISAPTSAGKSFVLLYRALDLLSQEDGVVVYIVPTISLINQVTKDFRSAIARLELSDIGVYQTYSKRVTAGGRKAVFILTQERAISALAQEGAFLDISMLIVDEIQNVERVSNEDDERSKSLLDALQEFIREKKPRRAVVSGPRVENIRELSLILLGSEARSISQLLPPVVNLTYSFAKKGKRVFLKQHAPAIQSQHELVVDFPEESAKGLFGGKQYREPVLDLLADIANEIGQKEGTIIFSPTSTQATNTAIALASRFQWSASADRIKSLLEYVTDTVHPQYALSQCLQAGVAFHHGKMPHHVRTSVERGFIDQDFHILTCTTTLMQGVNLPAKNIIARNPNLFIRQLGSSASLTAYEFGNLRGRAGRLMKDFVGRSIILDAGAFADDQITFDFPDKNVQSGYRERFTQNRKAIVQALTSGETPSKDIPSSDLLTVIRQSIMRFGLDAEPQLRNNGIELKPAEFEAARSELKRLELPRSLCIKVPYWDPLVLDDIYRAVKSGEIEELPKTAFDRRFVEVITNTLGVLRERAPYYYAKYFGEYDDTVIYSIVSTAGKWMREESLRSIISWESVDTSVQWTEIDRRLVRVNQSVVHDLPKVLRPISTLQENDNPLLGLIEMGAYRPEVRRLIELGLARETAIRIANRINLEDAEKWTDAELVRKISLNLSSMNYWEASQVKDLQWTA